MELLPSEISARIPPLYATEAEEDPMVQTKLFCPWTNWTLLVTEFDGKDTLFGWVYSQFPELGYSSLSEIERVQGPFGLRIERDFYFEPCRLSTAKEELYAVFGRR